jgi:hypothetical protein
MIVLPDYLEKGLLAALKNGICLEENLESIAQACKYLFSSGLVY